MSLPYKSLEILTNPQQVEEISDKILSEKIGADCLTVYMTLCLRHPINGEDFFYIPPSRIARITDVSEDRAYHALKDLSDIYAIELAATYPEGHLISLSGEIIATKIYKIIDRARDQGIKLFTDDSWLDMLGDSQPMPPKAPPRTPTYRELLDTPKWQRKRLEVFEHYGWVCNKCGDRETQLHVHHKTYGRDRLPWEYPMHNFEVLCKNCHEKKHNKKKYSHPTGR